MRLNLVYFKRKYTARAPQMEELVPFQELRPLHLKDSIFGKTQKNMSDSCLYEMSLVFACWKDNEFASKACKDLEQNLTKCYEKYLRNTAVLKKFQKRTVPHHDSKVFTSKQISYMLHMYPNV
ncbi:hypothetical protein WN48_10488 [Eufriesea mexicana]|uniref:Coiled-coil-helix-coiled-coil-helix domain-containing protein 1 n=2 Tax=Eufriesea mexicana TaxID=516756 RepID=A0A310SGA9_9HYME|nr:hypothetical protein WN48_10488 [Eufriesea mexicana]